MLLTLLTFLPAVASQCPQEISDNFPAGTFAFSESTGCVLADTEDRFNQHHLPDFDTALNRCR